MMTFLFRILSPCIPLQKHTVIFISFHGRGFSDNPRALYLAMKEDERFKNYRLIWALRKGVQVDIPGAKIVPYFRPSYFYYLARSRYWISNCKLPEYIVKKEKQIYLQTWHGTPLKRLAHDIIVPEGTTFYRSGMSGDAMRKTYDHDVSRYTYMISPNAFCTEVFQSAFQIERERLVETGYPRNDELSQITNVEQETIKQRYQLPTNKSIILYAPTWRDNQYNTSGYTFELKVNFHLWKEQLGNDFIVLFKPHYLITNTYIHDEALNGFIYDIDANVDIAQLYKIADVLITDYSSVFFDYAIRKKPIYFYMYDIEEYADELRGFYLDVHKELPGKIYVKEDVMLADIQQHIFDKQVLDSFNKRFHHMEDGYASKRVLDILYKKGGE